MSMSFLNAFTSCVEYAHYPDEIAKSAKDRLSLATATSAAVLITVDTMLIEVDHERSQSRCRSIRINSYFRRLCLFGFITICCNCILGVPRLLLCLSYKDGFADHSHGR